MIFLLGAMLLWGGTAVLLLPFFQYMPDVVVWGLWTVLLFTPSVTASGERWHPLLSRMGGVLGSVLVVLYYTTQDASYMTFLPVDSANPNLWPSIFLAFNLVAPLMALGYGLLARGYGR